MKITQAVDDWQLDLRAERKSPRTIHVYRQAAQSFVRHAGDDLDKLTRHEIRTWLAALDAKSEATQRSYFVGLSVFVRWLCAEDLIASNPMEGLRRPVAHSKAVEPFTDAEVAALIGTCTGSTRNALRDRAIILTLSQTGLRISELADIRLDDIDLEEQVIAVIGKGRKPRLVPFPDEAKIALRRYMRSRFQRDREIPYPWLSSRGRLTASGVDRMLRARGRKAGVDGVRAHRFTNTFAINWLSDGGSEISLMKLAGWNDHSMVKRYAAAQAEERALEEFRKLRPA